MTSLRLIAVVTALVLAAAAVVGVVLATHTTSATPPLPTIQPAKQAFPVPPPGAVVFAREDGPNALALAVVPGSPPTLQASVVGSDGKGVAGFRVQLAGVTAQPCGAGCYRATMHVLGRDNAVDVRVQGTIWRVALPQPWPPPDATRLLARAGHVWRNLHTLAFVDRLGSDAQHVIHTRWQVVAPDRIAYQIKNGSSGIVIGGRRWDKLPGDRWRASVQSAPVHQPVPFWSAVTDAHVLGSATFNGSPVWRVSFFDPHGLAWFDVAIDKQSLRTLDLKMVTTAHFMHEAYGPFNAPIHIVPPR